MAEVGVSGKQSSQSVLLPVLASMVTTAGLFYLFNSSSTAFQPPTEANDSKKQIALLEAKLTSTESALAELSKTVEKLANAEDFRKLVEELEKEGKSTVTLDASESSFSIAETEFGSIFVRVKEVRPYLNGQMVTLMLGNPHYVRFNGLKAHAEWGKPYDESAGNYDTWKNSHHTKDFDLTDSVLPGAWTPINIALTPAKPDEVGYLKLKLNFSTVILNEKSR